jgi:tetratricopeptide (TPR) repeat protein
MGKSGEAVRSFDQARSLVEPLHRAQPRVNDFQQELAYTLINFGLLYQQKAAAAEALPFYQQACALLENLVAANPAVHEWQSDLAGAYLNLAVAQRQVGRRTDALQSYESARKRWHRLIESEPAVASFQYELAVCYRNLGNLQKEMGDRAEALRSYQHSQSLSSKLVQVQPASRKYREVLISALNNVGYLRQEAAEWAPAVPCWRESAEQLAHMVQEKPDDLATRSDLGAVLNNLGNALVYLGRSEEGLRSYQEAIVHQRLAFEKAPGVAQHRRYLSNHYLGLAYAYRALGRPIDAAAASKQAARLWPTNPVELFRLAREVALCIPLVGAGKEELTSSEQAQRQAFANEAMRLLRQAVGNRFRDLNQLQKSAELAPLRRREDFKQLVRELEEAARRP